VKRVNRHALRRPALAKWGESHGWAGELNRHTLVRPGEEPILDDRRGHKNSRKSAIFQQNSRFLK